MVYDATKNPAGFTNNTKVSCGSCGSSAYVRPNEVAKNGGKWKCPYCSKVNGN